MLLPSGMTNSCPERASSTTKPPFLSASCLGVKYSTCICAGALHKRKIVPRRADLERLATTQVVVHVARAASARRMALDADSVALAIGFGVYQRVLPDQSIR